MLKSSDKKKYIFFLNFIRTPVSMLCMLLLVGLRKCYFYVNASCFWFLIMKKIKHSCLMFSDAFLASGNNDPMLLKFDPLTSRYNTQWFYF